MKTQGIGLDVYGRTDIGKIRESNDDVFVVADLTEPHPLHQMLRPLALEVRDRGVLLAVSDGMAGAQAGAIARAFTLQALRKTKSTAGMSKAELALGDEVEHANHRVWETAVGSVREGGGSALAAVLVVGCDAYAAELGEARVYVLRGSTLSRLSHDPGHAHRTLEGGALVRERASSASCRNLVAQVFGGNVDSVVTLSRFTMCQGDQLVLCTDGLANQVNDRELCEIVGSTSILDIACGTLIDLANARGGEDNMTVLLAKARGEALVPLSVNEKEWLEAAHAFTD